MTIYEKIDEAIAVLQKVDWVGSGAKALIEDAIGLLLEATTSPCSEEKAPTRHNLPKRAKASAKRVSKV